VGWITFGEEIEKEYPPPRIFSQKDPQDFRISKSETPFLIEEKNSSRRTSRNCLLQDFVFVLFEKCL